MNADQAFAANRQANVLASGIKLEAIGWLGLNGRMCCGDCMSFLGQGFRPLFLGPYKLVWRDGKPPGYRHVEGKCLRCTKPVEGGVH